MQNDMKLSNYSWIKDIAKTDIGGKKILVAGGTGFIGKRLLQILSYLNAEVYAITRRNDYIKMKNIVYLKLDLRNLVGLKEMRNGNRYDAAVYMAANIPLRGEKKETLFDAKRATLDPYLNFLEAFGEDVKQLIYISSIDAIGHCAQEGYGEEIFPDTPTPYGLAKYAGEFYTKSLAEGLDIPYAILRFSQVYGPNEPVVRIIPILKECLLENRQFSLITSGNEKRRYLYIDDAAQAVCRAIVNKEMGVFNIAGPDTVTVMGLIRLMERIWNRKLDLEVKNIKEGEDNIPSIDKAETLLGYCPEISAEKGLVKVKEEENESFG